MKALSGDFSEKTRRILAAGCDVVLHCNGVMDEMKAVAEAAPALSGKAAARARRASSMSGGNDGAVEQALRAEFAAMFEAAV